MSQALYVDLWYNDEGIKTKLMVQGLGTLWTEHSERATMRTWAQSARVPEDVRRQMGRWQPTADEGYERATRINVLRAQKTIGDFLRSNIGRSDPVDEAAVLRLVELKMEAMGMTEMEMQKQVRALSCFLRPDQEMETPWLPRWSLTGEIEYEVRGDNELPEVEAISDDDAEGLEEEPATQRGEVEGYNVRGQYVVSIVGRSGTRTLHKAGECYREPGVHYNHYELLGEDAPSATKYHKVCKVCFPKGWQGVDHSPEEDSSGEVSSSDSEGQSEEDL